MPVIERDTLERKASWTLDTYLAGAIGEGVGGIVVKVKSSLKEVLQKVLKIEINDTCIIFFCVCMAISWHTYVRFYDFSLSMATLSFQWLVPHTGLPLTLLNGAHPTMSLNIFS